MNVWMIVSGALYLIGMAGLSAMGRDLSDLPRSWRTRVRLVFWPITVSVGFVGDIYDNLKGAAHGRG